MKKNLFASLCIFVFINIIPATAKSLFGLKLFQNEIDLQSIYDDMTDSIPSIVLLQPEFTSGVPAKLVASVSEEIKNQMIMYSYFKPVSMDKWLASQYVDKKSKSAFQFISELSSERYSLNLKGICKSCVFKCGDAYVLYMAVYPFSNGGYPISAARIFKSTEDTKKAVQYCILDVSKLFSNIPKAKKKIAVAPFEISCRTLVEQKNGEFDFIKTSFSVQEGIETKETDDYFSRIFAYQAETTGLFNASPLLNLASYTESVTSVQNHADYLVKGTVILSNKINIITINLVKPDTGKTVWSSKYFTKRLGIQEIWKINTFFLRGIAGAVCAPDEYIILDDLSASGRGFYMNGMFAAWDKMYAMPVPAEKLVINTGTMFESDIALDSSVSHSKGNKDFFIYVDNGKAKVFAGREGEYVWNLLEK